MSTNLRLRTIDEAIGAAVAQYLFNYRLTRADLGRVLGMSSQGVSGKLHGRSKWTAEDMMMVSRLFGVSVDSLMPQMGESGAWLPAAFVASDTAGTDSASLEPVPPLGLEPRTNGLWVNLLALLYFNLAVLAQAAKVALILTIRDGHGKSSRSRRGEGDTASQDEDSWRSNSLLVEGRLASDVACIYGVFTASRAEPGSGSAMSWGMQKNKDARIRRPGPPPLPIPSGWMRPVNGWRSLLAATGKSAATVQTRAQHVRSLARGLGGTPFEVTAEDLLDWCGAQRWASNTRNSHNASFRSFFASVFVEEPQSSPATVLVDAPRRAGLPRPTTDEALREALASASPRDALLLRVLAETGLRIGEAVQIHTRDFSLDLLGHSLLVHGKGGRDRRVPLASPSLANALLTACEAGEGWAFPSPAGGHLTAAWAGKLVRDAFGGVWSAHTLRHRFATKANRSTKDIRAVQELLGHANLSTTQVYTEVEQESLFSAARAAAISDSAPTEGEHPASVTGTGTTFSWDEDSGRVHVWRDGRGPVAALSLEEVEALASRVSPRPTRKDQQ